MHYIKGKERPYNVIYVPEVFVPSFTDDRPYQIWRGSRFSAKSITKTIQLLVKAHTSTYFRGIFARQSNKTARDSQFQLFQDVMKWYPVLGNHFEIEKQPMKITHKQNGHYLQGASFEAPESLMSVPEVTDCWVDEPISRSGSIKRAAFEDISGTLRNKEGITPQFHFTFNPINKKNFIHDDFYDEKKAKYNSLDFNDVIANYVHNPFCPTDRVEYLDKMKQTNPTRYEVDGLGHWGEPQNDAPYLINYRDEYHYNGGRYKFAFGNYDTYLSFDFNHNPCTASVYQVVPGKGILGMRCYSQNGGTAELCKLMKEDKELMAVNRLLWTVTGDSNGRHHSATAGDVTSYEIIKKAFGLMDTQVEGVYSSNKALVYSRRICEAFLEHVPFMMDGSMEELRSDIMKAREDQNGNLYKVRKEGFGMDMFDNFRYFVHLICPNGIEDIEYLIRKLAA